MKTQTFFRKAGLLFVLHCFCLGAIMANGRSIAPPGDSLSSWFQPWLQSAYSELDQMELEYLDRTEPLRARLQDVASILADPRNRTPECGFQLLWEKNQLEETLKSIHQEYDLKLLKLRYRKSIEVVKMLYEKVLSMDHHLSSLKAQQGLSNLSNPHNYPEFKETRAIIEERLKKKYNIQMPSLFQTNPFLSATFSIVGLALSSGEEKDKKENIEKVACVLDFTVRMHNDLNVIYYETGYLRDANLTLKKDCESLFSDCARQVGYTIPLVTCREGDDWERLYTMLDNYVAKALGETNNTATQPGGYPPPANSGNQPTAPDPRLFARANTNLQFSIDRVGAFVEKYSNFVSQGGEYYKKFSKIASSYENEKACVAVLPDQFKQLKRDIDETFDKFNSAYKMPEMQGSKLKDMLYGTNYD
ncbi:MAG: hypothetical protein KF734_21415 [Saprospiraceae bacterium]|nr:hypothetical protein [Saprospiraceae bacterium]